MIAPAVAGLVLLAVGVATMAGWVGWTALGRGLVQHAGPAALFSAGAGLLITAGVWHVRLRRMSRWERGAHRALSWWTVAAAGVVVAAVGWAATDWLLNEAAAAKDPAAARVDAVKTGLSIAAGTGGVFALLLAVRRQWHQERATASTTHDATERRVTELYTKAADQLGSDKAPVRLAGLYALERVAQDNPGQRQTVVNVLCAYLRMPYSPPRTSPRSLGGRRPRGTSAPTAATQPPMVGADTVQQELEVRLTAQRVLTKHLHPGDDPARPVDTFWADIDLDLTGAALHGWGMAGCHVATATFSRAHFLGYTSFPEAKFAGGALFDEARFADFTWFERAQFPAVALFERAQFAGPAIFNGARFDEDVFFLLARFANEVSFKGARFAGPVDDLQTVRFEFGVPPEIAALLPVAEPDGAGRDQPAADPG